MSSYHPREDEKPVEQLEPERDERDQVMVPEILVNMENKPLLESAAPAPQTWSGGAWDGVACLTSTYTVLVLFTA